MYSGNLVYTASFLLQKKEQLFVPLHEIVLIFSVCKEMQVRFKNHKILYLTVLFCLLLDEFFAFFLLFRHLFLNRII